MLTEIEDAEEKPLCSICGEPFRNRLEHEMAPQGPDGTPSHYACLASITFMMEEDGDDN